MCKKKKLALVLKCFFFLIQVQNICLIFLNGKHPLHFQITIDINSKQIHIVAHKVKVLIANAVSRTNIRPEKTERSLIGSRPNNAKLGKTSFHNMMYFQTQ